MGASYYWSAALLALIVAAVAWATLGYHGKRCTPGEMLPSRGGQCVQFCHPDGKRVWPLCMVPHPMQLPDAMKLMPWPIEEGE